MVVILIFIFRKIVGLTVYGFKKSTTEEEVRTLFPQANSVQLFPLGGFAVLHYDLFEDCKLDRKNALGAEVGKRKLRIVFKYHSDNLEQPEPASALKASAETLTSRIFVKNLGRSATEEQLLKLFPNTKIISMPKKGKACRG